MFHSRCLETTHRSDKLFRICVWSPKLYFFHTEPCFLTCWCFCLFFGKLGPRGWPDASIHATNWEQTYVSSYLDLDARFQTSELDYKGKMSGIFRCWGPNAKILRLDLRTCYRKKTLYMFLTYSSCFVFSFFCYISIPWGRREVPG